MFIESPQFCCYCYVRGRSFSGEHRQIQTRLSGSNEGVVEARPSASNYARLYRYGTSRFVLAMSFSILTLTIVNISRLAVSASGRKFFGQVARPRKKFYEGSHRVQASGVACDAFSPSPEQRSTVSAEQEMR